VATGRKWEGAESGSNRRIGNRWQPTATVSQRMVRRGSRFESGRGLCKTAADRPFLDQADLFRIERAVRTDPFVEPSGRGAVVNQGVFAITRGTRRAGRGLPGVLQHGCVSSADGCSAVASTCSGPAASGRVSSFNLRMMSRYRQSFGMAVASRPAAATQARAATQPRSASPCPAGCRRESSRRAPRRGR
jgi:hypothetical protein